MVSFCSEANDSSISQACTWQEHVTLKWLHLPGTNFGIKTLCVCFLYLCVCLRVCVCVCVLEEGVCMCFAKKAKVMPFSACHQQETLPTV